MKIKSIKIKNFRSFRECTVDFDDYVSFVGPNGAGKSTVLYALNIFFRQSDDSPTDVTQLQIEDFHNRDTSQPIEITVTFCDLPGEAQEDLKEYFRQGELVITATAEFKKETETADVKHFGERQVFKGFAPFFEIYNDNGSVAELKEAFQNILVKHPELDKETTKDGMRKVLRKYEEENPDQCHLVRSEDQFYGFSRGSNRLAKYLHWIYVPAVKDATKENIEARNTALGRIIAHTVRAKMNFDNEIGALKRKVQDDYRELLDAKQSELEEISKLLSNELGQWAHSKATARLAWAEDPGKSVQIEDPTARLITGDEGFEGEIARFGHGLQRSYLLALLQVLVSLEGDKTPKLILGCEEPELYQHPPQARHLAEVLRNLSKRNAQVLLTTHSPYFVVGKHFESLRMVRRNDAIDQSEVSHVGFDEVSGEIANATGNRILKVDAQSARLHQALHFNLNEMFFASSIVFVEGLEDVAYLTSWLILTDNWDLFRSNGTHIIPLHGKSHFAEPLIIAKLLKIPFFTIFDSDRVDERGMHESDNKCILSILNGNVDKPFPSKTVWENHFVQWENNISDEICNEIGKDEWDKSLSKVKNEMGAPKGDYSKNYIVIGERLRILKESNIEIRTLDKLTEKILHFAKR